MVDKSVTLTDKPTPSPDKPVEGTSKPSQVSDKPIHVTDAEFDQVVKEHPYVIVDSLAGTGYDGNPHRAAREQEEGRGAGLRERRPPAGPSQRARGQLRSELQLFEDRGRRLLRRLSPFGFYDVFRNENQRR